MSRKIRVIVWVMMVVLLASCSSTKPLKKSHSIEGMSESEFVENVIRMPGDGMP